MATASGWWRLRLVIGCSIFHKGQRLLLHASASSLNVRLKLPESTLSSIRGAPALRYGSFLGMNTACAPLRCALGNGSTPRLFVGRAPDGGRGRGSCVVAF